MGAHFLQEGLAVFDAPFFSTTSAEASSMDLQQRGLFELHTERWRTVSSFTLDGRSKFL